MAESLAGWLALRRPLDFASRSMSITTLVSDHLARIRPLRVLDLGTGTGSNIQYLGPRLGGAQQWLAVDKDSVLLEQAARRSASVAADLLVETRSLDLGALTSSDVFDTRHLVTASAFLDLVSADWLAWVAAECHRVGACALFALTYNGRNECEPADEDDAGVFELFNRHQLTDKGLGGPATGPSASAVARRCFVDAGFDVRLDASDWTIEPESRELQRLLIEGWASAATEMAPEQRDRIAAWLRRRLEHLAAGRSRIVVGHYDLAALI